MSEVLRGRPSVSLTAARYAHLRVRKQKRAWTMSVTSAVRREMKTVAVSVVFVTSTLQAGAGHTHMVKVVAVVDLNQNCSTKSTRQ